MAQRRSKSGKALNREWQVGAKHALYRETGDWYHHLTRFPGALFDAHGYVLFRTKADYQRCPQLKHLKELHVPGGIAQIPSYVMVRAIDEGEPSLLPTAAQEVHEGAAKEIMLEIRYRNTTLKRRAIEKRGCLCEICGFDFGRCYGDLGTGFIELHHLN